MMTFFFNSLSHKTHSEYIPNVINPWQIVQIQRKQFVQKNPSVYSAKNFGRRAYRKILRKALRKITVNYFKLKAQNYVIHIITSLQIILCNFK